MSNSNIEKNNGFKIPDFMKNAVDFFKGKIGDYKDKYNPNDLITKIQETAKKAGATTVYHVLLLYYALTNEKIPTKDRILVIAALGYYISPLDFIPDFMFMGLLDDMSILGYVLTRVSAYIDDDVRQQSLEKLHKWFGNAEIKTLENGKAVTLQTLPKEIDEVIVEEMATNPLEEEFVEIEMPDPLIIQETEKSDNNKNMYVFAPYEELSAYIKKHYDKAVDFSQVSEKEMRVTFTQKTLLKDIRLGLTLKIEEVKGDQLAISYDGNIATNMVIPSVLSYLLGKLPELKEGITTEEGRLLKIDLSKIEKAKKITEALQLEDIIVEQAGLKVLVSLK